MAGAWQSSISHPVSTAARQTKRRSGATKSRLSEVLDEQRCRPPLRAPAATAAAWTSALADRSIARPTPCQCGLPQTPAVVARKPEHHDESLCLLAVASLPSGGKLRSARRPQLKGIRPRNGTPAPAATRRPRRSLAGSFKRHYGTDYAAHRFPRPTPARTSNRAGAALPAGISRLVSSMTRLPRQSRTRAQSLAAASKPIGAAPRALQESGAVHRDLTRWPRAPPR